MRELTVKERIFAEEVLRTGNKREAAKKAYNIGSKGGTSPDTTADSVANETAKKPPVATYIEDRVKEAKNIIFELAKKAKNETVRLNASKDIVDRTDGRAKESVEHSGSVTNYVITEGTDDKPMESTQESVEVSEG